MLVCDSAGHPRYRRTILRGLVGWAPHWTVLCIAADATRTDSSGVGATSTAQAVLGTAGAGVDLAMAHLDLCLKLQSPMAIIITKLDLVTRQMLQRTVSQILTAVKATGRKPSMLLRQNQDLETSLSIVPQEDYDAVQAVVKEILGSGDLLSVIPIVLASAVKGTGVGLTHALLENLPIPPGRLRRTSSQ